MCVMWRGVCACVSTGNDIGDEGAKALSQCMTHLTQLTHLDLSGECAHIDVLLGVICEVCESRQQHWI